MFLSILYGVSKSQKDADSIGQWYTVLRLLVHVRNVEDTSEVNGNPYVAARQVVVREYKSPVLMDKDKIGVGDFLIRSWTRIIRDVTVTTCETVRHPRVIYRLGACV